MASAQHQRQQHHQQQRLPAVLASSHHNMQQQQQQQPPWWAGPVNGLGAALQGVQHNLQQLAGGLQQQLGGGGHPPHEQRALPGSAHKAVLAARAGSATASTAAAAAAAVHASMPAAGSSSSNSKRQAQAAAALQPPVSKEELGRSTWVFLHTLAAQFPARPSRQQQRDARQLVDSLTRIYPCGDCAQHFREIVRRDPPDVSSGPAFAQWMCRTHNTVNRRLGKPAFNCDLVGARWAPLDCDEANSCDLSVGRPRP